MATFNNFQRSILFLSLVLLIGIYGKCIVFSFVYIGSFAIAWVWVSRMVTYQHLLRSDIILKCWWSLADCINCLKHPLDVIICERNSFKIAPRSKQREECENDSSATVQKNALEQDEVEFKDVIEDAEFFDVADNPPDNRRHCTSTETDTCRLDTGFEKSLISAKIISEIDVIVEYIIRDFVNSWYQDISSDTDTPKVCADTLTNAFKQIITRLSTVSKFTLVEEYAALFSKHLNDFQSARAYFRRQPNYRKCRDKEGKEYKKLRTIDDCFDAQNKFHRVLSNQHSNDGELKYLRCVMEVIFVNSVEKSLTDCLVPDLLLTEVLTCNVLLPLLDVVSDSHWLHRAIILLTSDEDIEICDQSDRFETSKVDESLSMSQTDSVTDPEPDAFVTSNLAEMFPLASTPINSDYASSPTDLSNKNDSTPAKRSLFFLDDVEDDITPLTEHSSSAKSDLENLPSDRSEYIPEGSDEFLKPGESRELRGKSDSNILLGVKDDKIFGDVRVTDTETLREPGGLGMFTVYCLQVEAWYPSDSSTDGEVQAAQSNVKRRYREFITLHERLDGHPMYKKSLKGIKGPSRWKILGKLQKETVEQRQKFLEEYMNTLLSRNDINCSMAMREFLAYDGDASIAFVKKATERFDQVLVRTMSGFLDRLRTVLDPADMLDGARSPLPGHTDGQPEGAWAGDEDDGLDFSYDEACGEDFSRTLVDFLGHHKDMSVLTSDDPLTGPLTERVAGDGCEREMLTQPCQLPLMEAVLGLALTSVEGRDTWVREERVLHIGAVTLGHALECWLHHNIQELTTEDKLAEYISKLRDTLWPNGELDRMTEAPPSDQQINVTKSQAKRCLLNFFPNFLPYVVGHNEMNAAIDEILDCISHPRLNRHFLYEVLDWLINMLYRPEVAHPKIRTRLQDQDPTHSRRKKKSI